MPPAIELIFGLIIGTALFSIGFCVFAMIMPIIPGAIQLLVNDPNRYKTDDGSDYPASRFGFFTFLEPGQVKIITRGDSFVRCIMKFDNHCFRGEVGGDHALQPNEQEYWEVIETPKGFDDSHPLRARGGGINLLDWYARYVYRITGAVFTGIPPFQTVRTYQIEKLVKKIGLDKKIDFVTKRDFSDHFRVAEFQLFLEVPEADTQDKIPVRVQVATTAKVVNPYLAAFGTDNWVNRAYTASTSKVTDLTRTKPLDTVLSAADTETENMIEKAIMSLSLGQTEEKDALQKIGITLTEAQVLDISVTNEETQKKLGDLAIARVEKNAEITRAEGRAKSISLVNDAIKDGGDAALQIAQIEGDVRKVAAAPSGAIVIIGQGGNVDPMQAAILRTLQQNTGR